MILPVPYLLKDFHNVTIQEFINDNYKLTWELLKKFSYKLSTKLKIKYTSSVDIELSDTEHTVFIYVLDPAKVNYDMEQLSEDLILYITSKTIPCRFFILKSEDMKYGNKSAYNMFSLFRNFNAELIDLIDKNGKKTFVKKF